MVRVSKRRSAKDGKGSQRWSQSVREYERKSERVRGSQMRSLDVLGEHRRS